MMGYLNRHDSNENIRGNLWDVAKVVEGKEVGPLTTQLCDHTDLMVGRKSCEHAAVA